MGMNRHFIGGGKHGRFLALVVFSGQENGRIVVDSSEMTEQQKGNFFDIPYDASEVVVDLAEKILNKDKSVVIESVELTDRGDILLNVTTKNDIYSFLVRKNFLFYSYRDGIPVVKYNVKYTDLRTTVSEYQLADENGETVWTAIAEVIVDPNGVRLVELRD